jgi:hypothetical protein
MSDNVSIDYLRKFKNPGEDHKIYIASVRAYLFQIINGLRWIKDKPGHILNIWTDLPEKPVYFELSWEDDVECRIELHDIDYGLTGDLKNLVGLVQLPGLFTRSLARDEAENEEIKNAIQEILGCRRDDRINEK